MTPISHMSANSLLTLRSHNSELWTVARNDKTTTVCSILHDTLKPWCEESFPYSDATHLPGDESLNNARSLRFCFMRRPRAPNIVEYWVQDKCCSPKPNTWCSGFCAETERGVRKQPLPFIHYSKDTIFLFSLDWPRVDSIKVSTGEP